LEKLIKPALFLVALVPFAILLARVAQNDLGPDPAQELSIETGEWSLRFLLLALAITPLRQLTGQVVITRQRRMLGLFALFYASVHFMVWLTFLLGFRWGAILEEILERPYVTVGFLAYLILVALGATPPKAMFRKLVKNWKRLHRLVYLAGILAIIHLLWILRTDILPAVVYGSVLTLLLGYRLQRYLRSRRARSTLT
jgi:methionine sulfoxide reductase heme-binding subunit